MSQIIEEIKSRRPSNFKAHPYDSIFQHTETEIVARNIMVILWRTGDMFRPLTWEEYEQERLKDGNFSAWQERPLFEKVIDYCINPELAIKFSPTWNKP